MEPPKYTSFQLFYKENICFDEMNEFNLGQEQNFDILLPKLTNQLNSPIPSQFH